MRVKAGDTASKVADAARQAGDQAKQAASALASDATKQAKGFLNMQVTAAYAISLRRTCVALRLHLCGSRGGGKAINAVNRSA